MAENDKEKDGAAKKLSFIAYHVEEGRDGKSYFHKVGVAFPHKDGKGHTIDTFANPINGRITLRTPQERLQAARDGKDATPERGDEGQER